LKELLVGLLVAVAYLAPSVVFAFAIEPAAQAVQRVGRAAAQ
jgi:hypothetical protein